MGGLIFNKFKEKYDLFVIRIEEALMKNISIIVLVYNEERHIERCIKSVLPFARGIFVVVSFSNDGGVEIAKSLGAKVYQNKWVNHATQFNL